MKRTQLIILAVLVAIAALVVAGCKDRDRMRISSILEKPDKYLDKDVIVAGKVVKTYAVNLFIAEAGAYQVDDGTGKIWVITKTGVPAEGTEVALKGNVGGALKLAGESFGSVIRESERKTR